MNKLINLCWFFISILFSCQNKIEHHTIYIILPANAVSNHIVKKVIPEIEKYFISKHLVNINQIDSTIKVDLKYATNQNFLHKPIYKGLVHCYLPCEVAIKLANAQTFLREINPNLSLIVFDATRPLSIQQKMWDELDLPISTKINYLAHPSDISLHNYGAAVDVGLITIDNKLLDMGTDFDTFDKLSEPSKEWLCLKDSTLSKEAYNNRKILRKVMIRAKFTPISSEWWHFNSTNKSYAAFKYELIK